MIKMSAIMRETFEKAKDFMIHGAYFTGSYTTWLTLLAHFAWN